MVESGVSCSLYTPLLDKNPDNVEECSRIFHSVQHAYEVLSDPHERAWYAFVCHQTVCWCVCVCVQDYIHHLKKSCRYDRNREEILYGGTSIGMCIIVRMYI